jgi:hypothetical protein
MAEKVNKEKKEKKENPTKFKKGHSYLAPKNKNVNKRSITQSLQKQIEREINHVDFFNEESRKEFLADAIAEKMLKRAYEGDVRAMNAVLDRLDGPVTQKIENINQGPDAQKQKAMIEKLDPEEQKMLMKLMEKMNG